MTRPARATCHVNSSSKQISPKTPSAKTQQHTCDQPVLFHAMRHDASRQFCHIASEHLEQLWGSHTTHEPFTTNDSRDTCHEFEYGRSIVTTDRGSSCPRAVCPSVSEASVLHRCTTQTQN